MRLRPGWSTISLGGCGAAGRASDGLDGDCRFLGRSGASGTLRDIGAGADCIVEICYRLRRNGFSSNNLFIIKLSILKEK